VIKQDVFEDAHFVDVKESTARLSLLRFLVAEMKELICILLSEDKKI
jgi:hypothetical protein